MNHAMSARSSGESAYVTFAVGVRQSAGNSAVARSKKEYGSACASEGAAGEEEEEEEEDARGTTARRRRRVAP
jgi:hypothetical protein